MKQLLPPNSQFRLVDTSNSPISGINGNPKPDVSVVCNSFSDVTSNSVVFTIELKQDWANPIRKYKDALGQSLETAKLIFQYQPLRHIIFMLVTDINETVLIKFCRTNAKKDLSLSIEGTEQFIEVALSSKINWDNAKQAFHHLFSMPLSHHDYMESLECSNQKISNITILRPRKSKKADLFKCTYNQKEVVLKARFKSKNLDVEFEALKKLGECEFIIYLVEDNILSAIIGSTHYNFIMMTPVGQTLGEMHRANINKYCQDISKALTFAHELKICHRDVKPSNIIVVKESAILIDWELAVAEEDDVFYDLSMTYQFAATAYLRRKWKNDTSFLYKKEYDFESLKYTKAFIESDEWPICNANSPQETEEYINKRDEFIMSTEFNTLNL